MCHRGLKVAAGKLTGVSARRDILGMADSGAEPVAVFTDFGVVTTNEQNAAPTARKLIAHLAFEGAATPDVIVLELGDGLLGTYGVHSLLGDRLVRDAITSVVVCASDPVGAWGAHRILDERYSLESRLISGPVTDTPAGIGYCTERLGVPTWNALRDTAPPLELLLPSVPLGPPLELVPRRATTEAEIGAAETTA